VTAKQISSCILKKRKKRSRVIPNFTPKGWWETDVCEITKSGFFREYEIKVTRADFLNDSSKSREVRRAWNPQTLTYDIWSTENKHQMVGSRAPGCPSQFWFVVPENLVAAEEVPDWAGLIYIRHGVHGRSRRAYFSEREIKAAPRLHRSKVDEEFKALFYTSAYFRFVTSRIRDV